MEKYGLDELDEILSNVACPARYIGGEINMVKKAEADIRFLLFFPDLYELGMSNLGFQLLYFLLNERADTYCERAFTPWGDMAEQMREKGVRLYSLETFTPISEFDIIGVSLPYELCYANVPDMLSLAGIPFFSRDRGEQYPLVIAGGLCTYNPEPMADFFDCFYIGEGEEHLDDFINLYREHKSNGGSKAAFLEKAAGLDAIYVPSLYDVEYDADGTIKQFAPIGNVPKTVKKAFVKRLDDSFYPQRLLIPLIEITQGRVVKEIFRGCIRGCRFCQAGYVNRPQREKSVPYIAETIKRLTADSGYEEISLMSLSTSDYSEIKSLLPAILDALDGEAMNISLPSLRVDNFSLELFERFLDAQAAAQAGGAPPAARMKKAGLTFAPEAGTQRLRDVINKNLTEEEILSGVSEAYKLGYDKIKLYFMSGLPTETSADLEGIAELCEKIYLQYYELPKESRGRPVSVSASCSCFVPKPHTPFQWDKQSAPEDFMAQHNVVKRKMRRQIRYTYHEAHMAVIEGALSRGDRRVAKAVCNAHLSGCRLDGWSELFDIERWRKAFSDAGLSIEFYNNRERAYNEILPWEHISCGVSKEFLIHERELALRETTSANCREGCNSCGINRLMKDNPGGVCIENKV